MYPDLARLLEERELLYISEINEIIIIMIIKIHLKVDCV